MYELQKVVSPKESHAKVVMDYLSEAGVAREQMVFSKVGDKVHVSMTVKVANKALNTEFALFQSTVKSDVVMARITKPYHLPTHVAEVVSFVDDILRFPSLNRFRLSRTSHDSSSTSSSSSSKWTLSAAKSLFNSCGSKCLGFTTPSVLSQTYGFKYMTSAASTNSMAVAEFNYQYYTASDLSFFSQKCGIHPMSVQTTIGGNVELICSLVPGACTEALLDIEYIKAVANAVPLTVIYSNQYSLLAWIDTVLNLKTPPLVHSVSYGNDEVQQSSVQYMFACNFQFIASGVRGLSILFASGDSGVWGGFSTTFARPSWQSSAVSAYLNNATLTLPPSSYYNATGRGYPDVSALGGGSNPYCVSDAGQLEGVWGTSASVPVVAGIVAQLNDIRLKAGKSSLGFLNPLIYANPKCFNDVNDGSNNACAGIYGFPAVTGW